MYPHGPEHMSGIVRPTLNQPWLSSGMLKRCLICLMISVVKPKTTGRPTATPHSRTTTGEGANFLGSQMAKHDKYYQVYDYWQINFSRVPSVIIKLHQKTSV